jgi:hypothetical protein
MTFTCDTIAVGISGKKLRIPLAPFDWKIQFSIINKAGDRLIYHRLYFARMVEPLWAMAPARFELATLGL